MKFLKIGEFVDFAFAALFTAAILALLILSGCSDVTAGGTAEETSIETAYDVPKDTVSKPADTSSMAPVDTAKEVLYKIVNLQGSARSVAQLPNMRPELSLDSVIGTDTVFKPVASELIGHTVRLSELDSVTLLPTGVNYLSRATDSAGVFNFDTISLNSPYIMLELSPYRDEVFWLPDSQSFYWFGYDPDDYDSQKGRFRLVYKAIVDLRDSVNLEINALTFLETARIQYLVKNGAAFAAAKSQAVDDVLAFLGVDGNAFDMQNPRMSVAEENLGYMLENWARYHSAKAFADTFATTATVVGHEWMRNSIALWLFNWYEFYIPNNLDATDENEIEFMNNFLASFVSAGRCTAGRDGFDTTIYDLEFRSQINRKLTLVCESEKWNVTPGRYTMAEKIEFVMDSVIDVRDGKTYKTVTYTIDGENKTWFAENLTYSNDSIQPKPGLDSNIIEMNQGRDRDFIEYMDSRDSAYWNTVVRYDSSDVLFGDEINMETGRLQGICPDGWHIPTTKEWSHLMYFAEVETGMSSHEKAKVMLEYDEFGWYASMYLSEVGFGDFTLEAFAIVDYYNDTWSLSGFVMDNWKPSLWGAKGGLSIRCVKD